MDNEYYVLEWSESQKAFDVCPLESKVDQGLRAFLQKKFRSDWLFLGVYPSSEEAHAALDAMALKRGLVWTGEKYEEPKSANN